MKCLILLQLIVLVAGLQKAEICNEEACHLPNCSCSSTSVPGGLRARDVPQLVTVTFDDAINVVNLETYRTLLYHRVNSNGCPIGATFYANHEYTNYQAVSELYNKGYEIGLHSITHRTPSSWWAEASYDDIKQEIADQREQMAHFANIPKDEIKGMRIPFLQLAGNVTYQVMMDHGLLYDCSWATTSFNNPPLWPYTLDYATIQDCPTGPCPTASLPGVWVQPMVSWTDLQGFPCAMADSCAFAPDFNDADAWYEFIVTNFERHYLTNRAPFGLYIHEGFLVWSGVRGAYIRFLNLLNTLPDVFMVNSAEVIEWMQNPIPVDEYRRKPCRTFEPRPCTARTCPLTSEHNGMQYWMTACAACPRTYPWVGNPLGTL